MERRNKPGSKMGIMGLFRTRPAISKRCCFPKASRISRRAGAGSAVLLHSAPNWQGEDVRGEGLLPNSSMTRGQDAKGPADFRRLRPNRFDIIFDRAALKMPDSGAPGWCVEDRTGEACSLLPRLRSRRRRRLLSSSWLDLETEVE